MFEPEEHQLQVLGLAWEEVGSVGQPGGRERVQTSQGDEGATG